MKLVALARLVRTALGRRRGAATRATGWARVEEVFAEALEHPPGDREQFVDRLCAGDERLRAEVLALLAASEAVGPVDRPLDDIVVSLLQSDDATAPAGAPTVVSHYELLERIRGGGMGVIYRARDTQLERIVALKFLPTALGSDRTARARFLLEARAAAALDHRNVCTIHEIGETGDGQYFIVMPFYDGETLADRIARGPLPVAEAVSIAGQVALGLAHAHERGSIHRDIKPANLMVTTAGVVKILDFGIVKQGDRGFTRTGAALGTLAYMSPEQLRREQVDARTDLWSLGVVLYEMLAGRRPFERPDEHTLRDAIAFAQPPSLRILRPEISDALARLVTQALAKHPDDRPASVAAVASALEELELPGVASSPRTTVGDRRPGEVSQPASDRYPGMPEVLPGGERRHATIVVAGLYGYAELVERCAPEEVNLVSRRFRQDAWEIVEREGGTINEFGEDRIVMLFGVPATLEDPSVRAARAALQLRALVRKWRDAQPAARHLALHTAIDAGDTAVQRAEAAVVPYRVAGRPVRRAAQLCAHARTDEILVSPEVGREIRTQFDLASAAPLTLADDVDAITPMQVLREAPVQDRLDELAGKAALTTFIGREAELATLLRTFDEARANRVRLVTISGEAGIGKSRLLLEFRRHLVGAEVLVAVGRCTPYAEGAPYQPLLEVLRQVLHLDSSRRAAWTDGEIAARVTALSPGLQVFIPFYLRLLSVGSHQHRVPKLAGEDHLRLALQEALLNLLTAAAARQPVVVIFEDWHWADPASQAFLEPVADLSGDHPLMVLVTSRTRLEGRARQREAEVPLPLRPLEPTSTSLMLRAMLEADDVPRELAAHLHERSGGNPFFLEEVVRSLLEAGGIRVAARQARLADSLEALRLPASVQAVIRTRLDRLDLQTRRVLRAASVVGRDFTRDILERVLANTGHLDSSLDTLVAAGIVQQTSAHPEAAFRFKHALAQEAAHAGLLEHQRGDLHGRVGAAIEEVYQDRLDDWLNRLAQHFSLAEDWPRAVRYGLRSAERMLDLIQYLDALQLLDRVRAWVQMLDREEQCARLADVLFLQEQLCDMLGMRERQRHIVDELIALLESERDLHRLAEAYRRRGDLHTNLGLFELAEGALQESLRLRREAGDALGARTSLRGLAFLRWSQNRYDEALAYNEEALRIVRQEGQLSAMLGDLHNLATLHAALGQYDRARACLEEALKITEPARDSTDPAHADLRTHRVYVLHNYGCLLTRLGDLDGALEYLGPNGEWTHWSDGVHRAHFFTAAGHVHLQKGMLPECLEDFRQAIEASRSVRFAPMLAQALLRYGEILLTLGRAGEALGPLDEAANVYAELTNRTSEALSWSRVAAAHERLANIPAACARWEQVLVLRRSTGDRSGELEALEHLGRLARQHQPSPVALRYYDDALLVAEAIGDRAAAARICNSAGIVEWMRGQHAAALERYQRGLELFRAVRDEAGEGLTLNSIGVVLNAMGRPDAARAQFEEALRHHRRADQPQLEAHALAALGDLCWDSGDREEAFRCYALSLQKRQRLQDVRGEGWMLQRLARAHAARGEQEDAAALLARATELSAACSDDELQQACTQLGGIRS